MKRVLNWLRRRQLGRSASVESEQVRVRAAEGAVKMNDSNSVQDDEIPFDAEVSGAIESLGSEKNVLVTDDYDSECVTVPNLRVLDEEMLSDLRSDGFDPYDSGSYTVTDERKPRR